MRTLSILAGLMLVVFGLVFLGIDLIDTLEAHGFFAAGTIGDVWNSLAPNGAEGFIRQVCAPLPDFCPRVLHAGLNLYAWVLPGVCGVLLIWLAAGHRRRS